MQVPETSLVKTHPEQDLQFIEYQKQAREILKYAESRIVGNDLEVKDATNDLSIISTLKKGIEEKRQEYVKPLNEYVKTINTTFKALSDPIEQADKITRNKILSYRAELEAKRREAEEINRQKEELAKREAALNQGVITIDTTPIPVPEAAPSHVRAEMGTMGTAKIRKWEVEDLAKVPLDYLMINATKIGKVVRAGIPSIPGIRIWEEDSIRITR